MTTIRQLTESDYEDATRIFIYSFDLIEHPTSDFDDSWDSRSQENSYGLFLSNGALAGFVLCTFHDKTSNNLYIDYLAVDESLRGQGHGSTLLQYLVTKSRDAHRGIHLFPDSFSLVNWYKKFGFYETPDSDPLPGKPPFYLNLSPYPRRNHSIL